MPNSLAKDLRNLLARVTLEARDAAEQAARSALENLAVHEKDYRPHMSAGQRQLRNRLRERGRALGDVRDERTGRQDINHLKEDVAYEHWHRLLFTRFLAENGLLHTDSSQGNVPITLAECDELAAELGARDGFELACRFASQILPGVFRPGDPVFDLTLAVNDQVELRKQLHSLPPEVFIADDALGWTYQFWQAKRKDEVNASGKKIGADELAAVTQLFTEDYMVEFLLHNTIGAWWARKLGSIHANTEDEARAKAGLPLVDGMAVDWRYLRFVEDEQRKKWKPAAGPFEHWPTAAKDITFLDPCMGSGHFLVFVLPLLARLRMQEERLTAAKAVYAVLRDNLHGLEIDPRCAQIAAFNLALSAWKLGGYQPLPSLHLACSGLAPHSNEKQWVALAGGNDRLRVGMSHLYTLFKDGPVLGSLINPRAVGDLLEAEFHELQPLLEDVLAHQTNDTAHELVVIARGVAKAAEILARQFTLIATNVPYLGRGSQEDALKEYSEDAHPDAKADLATCFVERCLSFCEPFGSAALVTPQSWLIQESYQDLRRHLLTRQSWRVLAKLGPRAFEMISGEQVNVALVAVSVGSPGPDETFLGIDAASLPGPVEKDDAIRSGPIQCVSQKTQLTNPGSKITLHDLGQKALLGSRASSFQGIKTGDDGRVRRYFWELPEITSRWRFFQSTVDVTKPYGGMEGLIDWLDDGAGLARRQGLGAWGRRGVMVSQMGGLPAALFIGDAFDSNASPIIPKDGRDLPAVWAFCSSPEYPREVRKIDQSLKPTNTGLIQVPFDIERWRELASKEYPQGLPLPQSNDATQWIFGGHPSGAEQALHVAVARLVGYAWPRQTGSNIADCPALPPDGLEALADADGVVCLASINREQPAAHRLRALLVKALGKSDERALITCAGGTGSKSSTLEEWLRDEFFEQHCELFHQRPFIWHIWDGRKDGFHALVNYHKLDHAGLQKLTYAYLGDWIRQQEEDAKADKPGADARLGAARALQAELTKILEGEAPYDIFVRWKQLAKQPVGWHPDLNDGVRLNIRPFVTADILRKRVRIKWEKDRGKEPDSDKNEYPWFWCEDEPDTDPEPGRVFTGHRWNSVHLTIQRKRRTHGGR